MCNENSELLRDISVWALESNKLTSKFNTTTYADGLMVDYAIELSFLTPTSGPILTEHELKKIVFESLSTFLKDLERDLQGL